MLMGKRGANTSSTRMNLIIDRDSFFYPSSVAEQVKVDNVKPFQMKMKLSFLLFKVTQVGNYNLSDFGLPTTCVIPQSFRHQKTVTFISLCYTPPHITFHVILLIVLFHLIQLQAIPNRCTSG